jgi:V/A-type H+-transporting ATPase subunit I
LILPEEFRGTPAEINAAIRKAIDASKQKTSELTSRLERLARDHQKELHELYWDVHVSRMMADAIVRFGQLRHTYVVVGWVPTENLEFLTQRLKQASPEILIETIPTERSGHHTNVPVSLTTNRWLRPIQMLVTTYGRPSYGELDPTWLMAITFPLLFGAMFGDLGQGLVLLLAGLLIDRGIIMKGMQSLGLLIAYCGASAAIFGYLYGSIFLFEGHLIEEYLGFHFEAPWISPINEILPVLSLAIDAGIVILLLSFLLGIFNNIRARDWPHLVFGHTGIVMLAFYIAFLALLGSFLGTTALAPRIAVAIGLLPLPWTILAIVFGILVMFSAAFRNSMEGHRAVEGSGVGGCLMFGVQSFMDLFESVISLLSNTLSFVRVGAFAVAHGGLSLAILSLAGEEPDPGFWITIIIGNLFIIGFEGLIVGIQTMRLHYYEILGKFFHGGGMRFEPLTLNPRKEDV